MVEFIFFLSATCLQFVTQDFSKQGAITIATHFEAYQMDGGHRMPSESKCKCRRPKNLSYTETT